MKKLPYSLRTAEARNERLGNFVQALARGKQAVILASPFVLASNGSRKHPLRAARSEKVKVEHNKTMFRAIELLNEANIPCFWVLYNKDELASIKAALRMQGSETLGPFLAKDACRGVRFSLDFTGFLSQEKQDEQQAMGNKAFFHPPADVISLVREFFKANKKVAIIGTEQAAYQALAKFRMFSSIELHKWPTIYIKGALIYPSYKAKITVSNREVQVGAYCFPNARPELQ